jgi:hypothetical protein
MEKEKHELHWLVHIIVYSRGKEGNPRCSPEGGVAKAKHPLPPWLRHGAEEAVRAGGATEHTTVLEAWDDLASPAASAPSCVERRCPRPLPVYGLITDLQNTCQPMRLRVIPAAWDDDGGL